MDFMHMFLSFNGRLRRLHFWIGVIILWVVEWVISMFTLGPAMAQMATNPQGAAALLSGMGLIGSILYLALLWPSLALQVKRWHDRDKSGWWVLINLVPFIGWLWTLIECGFMDGTPGPNKFGPSPKGIAGPAQPAPAT